MSFVPFTSDLATLSYECSCVLFINANTATTSEFKPGCSTEVTSLLDALLHLPTTSSPQSTGHFPPHFSLHEHLCPLFLGRYPTPDSDIEGHSLSSILALYFSLSKWLCVHACVYAYVYVCMHTLVLTSSLCMWGTHFWTTLPYVYPSLIFTSEDSAIVLGFLLIIS